MKAPDEIAKLYVRTARQNRQVQERVLIRLRCAGVRLVLCLLSAGLAGCEQKPTMHCGKAHAALVEHCGYRTACWQEPEPVCDEWVIDGDIKEWKR